MTGGRRRSPAFPQENFSEYHLYTLDRRTSIQNNESKQISLLTGTKIPVEKYLRSKASNTTTATRRESETRSRSR